MKGKVNEEYYSLAQSGLSDLKEAVYNLLNDNQNGLKGSDIGRLLGIHKGFTKGGHTGWVTRIVLERLREDKKVTRDHKKTWFAVNDR